MNSETVRPSSSSSSDSEGSTSARSLPRASGSGSGSGSGSMGDGGEPASVDDLGLALKSVKPDPYLGEFKPGPVESSVPPATAALGAEFLEALDLDVPPSAAVPDTSPSQEEAVIVDSSSGVSVDISALNLDPPDTKVPASHGIEGTDPSTSAPGPIVAIDLGSPPASKAAQGAAEEEDEDLPPRRLSLPMALLASYASAVTIGLIWVLWGHRAPRDSTEVDAFPPADRAADPGRRAGQSRTLEPPPPLPAGRVATLGQTLEVGSLAVTPLEIDAVPVILRREVARAQVRLGGNDALALRLRLKNVSGDSILAPLDEAFLRERGRGVHDSYIETGANPRIDMFPLAIVSEWSIIGQEFRELKPGESYETLVFTTPDALAHLAPEMTWRLRLRTDINQAETVGVRFRADDVHRPSESDTHELDDTL